MDLLEKAKLKKLEATKPKEISKPILKPKRLHPPPEPKTDHFEESFEDTYKNIIESSETKRFIYFIYTGKTWRGTNAGLEKDLIKRKQKIDIVNSPQFTDVLKEMNLNFKNGILKPSEM